MQITTKSIEDAIGVLSKSRRGQNAMRNLLAFLENGGDGLDQFGQEAAATLIAAAFSGMPGSVKDHLRNGLLQRGWLRR